MHKMRLGDMELGALFALEEREAGVITLAELAKELKLSRLQAWKLSSRLVRKKRLIRLKRGIYLFAPMKAGRKGLWTENALVSVSRLMEGKDYYVGFWTALNHYGLTEQIPITVQVVTTSRQRAFEALQTRFEFIQVRRLGEWQEEEIDGNKIKFATIEQLVLDCLALPQKSGGVKEACKALWNARKKLDWAKFEALASKSNEAVKRRSGYIAELLGVGKFKLQKFSGWRWLDSSAPKKALAKSKKWGLLLNVPIKELVEWREY